MLSREQLNIIFDKTLRQMFLTIEFLTFPCRPKHDIASIYQERQFYQGYITVSEYNSIMNESGRRIDMEQMRKRMNCISFRGNVSGN